MNANDTRKQVISDIAYFVEKQIDNFIINKQRPKFSFYKYLVSENVDKKTINEFKDYPTLNDTYEEVLLAYNKEDPYLVEAYGNFKKSQLREFLDMLESFIQDIARYAFEKNVRKPRKKRSTSPDKLVSKLKYAKEMEVGGKKYLSVDPREIIGKKVVYVYDFNQSKLSVYYSDSLSIKSTSIINFDEQKSWSKRVKLSNTILDGIMSSPKQVLNKLEEQIKTSRYAPTGRVNSNCIILRVF